MQLQQISLRNDTSNSTKLKELFQKDYLPLRNSSYFILSDHLLYRLIRPIYHTVYLTVYLTGQYPVAHSASPISKSSSSVSYLEINDGMKADILDTLALYSSSVIFSYGSN